MTPLSILQTPVVSSKLMILFSFLVFITVPWFAVLASPYARPIPRGIMGDIKSLTDLRLLRVISHSRQFEL